MCALKAIATAALLAITAPALGKDFFVGDKFSDTISESSMILACHPSELAFTVGGAASAGFSAVAWTFKVKVGDTFIANTTRGKSIFVLKSMQGCIGSFEETTGKQAVR